MPIPVTCPECQYHFLVDDEFAGRPGRCPECAAVIQVPDPEPTPPPPLPEVHEDPYPYRTPRAVEAFEDFPSRTRRSRDRDPEHDDDDRDRHERDLRDDYEEGRGARGRGEFDAHARAAAWERVYKGLGYIQLGVILYFFGQLLQMGFIIARGLDKLNENALPDGGEIAVGIGGLVVVLAAGAFWLLGRIGGMRVPYVPARGWARVSFWLSLAGVMCMLVFCCSFVMIIAMLAQQGPNPGAVLLLGLSVLVIGLGGLLLVGAEACALVSLVKIGDGLRARSAASWARQSLVLLFVLIGLLVTGFCGFTIYSMDKQKQKGPGNAQAKQKNNINNPAPPVKEKEKEKEKDKDAPPPNGQQPPQQQQQNPFAEEDPVDEKTKFAFQAGLVGLILLYLLHYSVGLQKARRAIREEMQHLTGSTDGSHGRGYGDDADPRRRKSPDFRFAVPRRKSGDFRYDPFRGTAKSAMPIPVTCPSCHRTFRVADEYAGRRGRCPDCGEVVRVPDEELPHFDPIDDDDAGRYSPARRRGSRERSRRPSPQDHLPTWRRVSTGFFVQQAGVGLNLLALGLFVAALTVLSDDPGDFEKEPNTGEMVASSVGALAAFLGLIVQVVGRFVSAGTPVKAPRTIGFISAIGTAALLPAMCVVGGMAALMAGAGNDPAAATLAGLGMFGYMTLWVACEATHGAAMGSVGRVLRADGLRALGRGLAVAVVLGGVLAMVCLCGFGVWAEANNPNGQNPAAAQTENHFILGWLIGTSVITGLYWMLDMVLLQQGRSAIARIAQEDEAQESFDDWR